MSTARAARGPGAGGHPPRGLFPGGWLPTFRHERINAYIRHDYQRRSASDNGTAGYQDISDADLVRMLTQDQAKADHHGLSGPVGSHGLTSSSQTGSTETPDNGFVADSPLLINTPIIIRSVQPINPGKCSAIY